MTSLSTSERSVAEVYVFLCLSYPIKITRLKLVPLVILFNLWGISITEFRIKVE